MKSRNSISKNGLRVIVSGGGTGGHVFPAIAIADKIKSAFGDSDILFIGAKGRMEMEKVPAAGYPIKGLWISGLQRKLTLRNLAFPFKVLKSLCDAWRITRRFRPDIVIGVGGYASGPTLFMASRMGIPTLIQEQNSFPGITNRLLAKRVDRICVAYDGLERFFPAASIRMTGNPVRNEMVYTEGKREQALKHFGLAEGKPVLLVIGGSLGARTINRSVHHGLDKLAEAGIQVIWQTGKIYAEAALEATASFQGIKAVSFIKEMDFAYAAADIVVSRAGAIAVSELCLVGKPTILVPSPNVAEDHQTRNARALAEKSAAILVRDTEANETLVPMVISLFENEEKKDMLSANIRRLAVHDAAERIMKEILGLLPDMNLNEPKR